MNFLKLSCFNFFLFYFFIQLIFYQQCSCYSIKNNLPPRKERADLRNGPIDLPENIKLNLISRKYKYHLREEKEKDIIDDEAENDLEDLKEAIKTVNIPQEEHESYKEELNYDYPPWLIEIIDLSDKSKKTLNDLGVEKLPDVNLCKEIKNLKEKILCIIIGLEEIKETYENAKEITSLTSRVLAGGRLAVKALFRLKTLASSPTNKQLMKSLGTPMVALILMQREITSDRNRWLVGTILTLLTDIPVVSDLADIKTGSYGHVNVIMPRQSRIRNPDRNILRLREGSSPSSLINGYTTLQAEYSI